MPAFPTALLHGLSSVFRFSIFLPVASGLSTGGQLPLAVDAETFVNSSSCWHRITHVEKSSASCIGTLGMLKVHINTVRSGLYSLVGGLIWASLVAILNLRARKRTPVMRDAATSPTAPRAASGAFAQYLQAYGGNGPSPQVLAEAGTQEAEGPSEITDVYHEVEVDAAPHIQNAKIFFVSLVALAHCQKTTGHWRWNVEIRDFVSTWCTRGLAFCCGITAQDVPNKDTIRRLLFYEACPLVLYCVVFEPVVLPLIEGRGYGSVTDWGHRIISNLMYGTAGATWFLFALLFWRIWGWMLMAFRTPWRLPVAMTFWVVAGYGNMASFKLGQAFASFPLFAAGQLFPYDFVVQNLPMQAERVVLGVLCLLAALAAGGTELGQVVLGDLPSWGWAGDPTLEADIAHCGAGEAGLIWMRGLFRNVMELSKTLIVVFFVCPRQRLPGITDAGAHLLYPYLLQYAVLEIQNGVMKGSFHYLEVSAAAWVGIWAAQFTSTLLVVVCLGSPPVRFAFSALLEPRWVERLVGGGAPGLLPSSGGKAPFVSLPSPVKLVLT